MLHFQRWKLILVLGVVIAGYPVCASQSVPRGHDGAHAGLAAT